LTTNLEELTGTPGARFDTVKREGNFVEYAEELLKLNAEKPPVSPRAWDKETHLLLRDKEAILARLNEDGKTEEMSKMTRLFDQLQEASNQYWGKK